MINRIETLQPGGPATQVDLSGGPVTTAIPTLASGEKPKFVLIQGENTAPIAVGFGQSGVTAAGTPHILLSRAQSLIINVCGMTHCGAANGSGNMFILPLANGGGIGVD